MESQIHKDFRYAIYLLYRKQACQCKGRGGSQATSKGGLDRTADTRDSGDSSLDVTEAGQRE